MNTTTQTAPRLWIVEAGKPFPGWVQSVITPEGTVAYSNGQTFAEYQAEHPGQALETITDAQLDELMKVHEAGLITDATEETADEWQWALECLPPCRWHDFAGVNLFHVSERMTADLVSWHARLNGKFYTFTDQARASSAHLARKVDAAVLAGRGKA
jgi:hypothetical protein